jgi:hypothetical protein
MDWRQLILEIFRALTWTRTLQVGLLIAILTVAAAIIGHVLLTGIAGAVGYRAIRRLISKNRKRA